MSRSISEFIGVSHERFAETGAFDAVLNVDSRFYIHPLLLQNTAAPELAGSYEKVRNRFGDILKLLETSKEVNDPFWREANRLFSFGELKGLCIGYSHGGTAGSGMGPSFRAKILKTAKQIVDAGINDPAIFELMGVLEEGVGSDRISDMLARIITSDILRYSHRVFEELGATGSEIKYEGQVYRIPINPHNRYPILLVPQDILRPLPVARSWDEIEMVCEYNSELRRRLNAIISGAWRRKGTPPTRAKKHAIRQAFLASFDTASEVIDTYRAGLAPAYDMGRDPVGEIVWHRETRRAVSQNPMPLSLPTFPKPEDVLAVVLRICEKFKELVEDNALNSLLYDGRSRPKHESAAQKVFYGVADSYCEANNLDLSPEINSGRGYVDFKVSRGYQAKVVVEVKLTTNSNVRHGYEVQLAEYQKAERTSEAVYVIVDVVGGSQRQANEVALLRDAKRLAGEQTPELILVDAKPKRSASKYVPEAGSA